MEDLLTAALSYAARGWPVVPLHTAGPAGCSCGKPGCPSPGKHPRVRHGLKDATLEEKIIRRWWEAQWPDANIALVTGAAAGLVVLDVDVEPGGEESLELLARKYGRLPATVEALTGGGGRHLLFRHPGRPVPNRQQWRDLPGLDVRGDGGYIVAPPSRHVSGRQYHWEASSHPDETPLADLPDWLAELLTQGQVAPAREGARLARDEGQPAPVAPVLAGCGWLRHCVDDAKGLGEAAWYAMLTIVGRCEDGDRLAQAWSKPHPGYDPLLTTQKLTHARTDTGPYTCAVIRNRLGGEPYCSACLHWEQVKSPLALARGRLADLEPPPEPEPNEPPPDWAAWAAAGGGAHGAVPHADAAPGGETPETPETPPGRIRDDLAARLAALPEDDLGAAARFIRRHGAAARYCPAFGGWLAWDGVRWEPDEDDLQTLARAQDTARKVLLEPYHLGEPARQKKRLAFATACASGRGQREMLAAARPALVVSAAALDADPWRLNVENGTLDLRTGELHAHRRADLITRVCPVVYDAAAPAPRWLSFLRQIFQDRAELVAYMQRVVGFCLTGVQADRVMFFLYGEGRNGKSTFVEQLHALLAGYAKKTTAETLLAKPHGDGIPHDLADLRGARLVTSAELTEGRRLNEARIKDLTGRDLIKARFLHQEFFEYRAAFKLFMYGNHKPTVRGGDAGIWDRVKLVPFDVRIAEDDVDEHLPAKLREELPGVLAWAVEGCIQWQQGGLLHPEAVTAATQAYRAEEDPLRDFLQDACILAAEARVTNPDLWQAYLRWCEQNGEKSPLGRKTFTQRLLARGFGLGRTAADRFWNGIGLRDTRQFEDRRSP